MFTFLTTLLTIWIMIYGRHDNRMYVLKDPPKVVLQWTDLASCKASPHFHAMPNSTCVQVKSVPSCYNDGSVCTFDPVDEEARQFIPKMVQPPR